MNGVSRPVYVVGIVGGALALVGSRMPWASVEIPGAGVHDSHGWLGDGVLTAVASALVLLGFTLGMRGKPPWAPVAAGVVSLFSLVLAVVNLLDVDRQVRADLESEGAPAFQVEEILASLDSSTGYGVYMVLAGAMLSIGAAAAAFLTRRRG